MKGAHPCLSTCPAVHPPLSNSGTGRAMIGLAGLHGAINTLIVCYPPVGPNKEVPTCILWHEPRSLGSFLNILRLVIVIPKNISLYIRWEDESPRLLEIFCFTSSTHLRSWQGYTHITHILFVLLQTLVSRRLVFQINHQPCLLILAFNTDSKKLFGKNFAHFPVS